jgi:proteic killer suppression protein
MNIEIPDRRLKKALEEEKECRKCFGTEMAKKIRLRLVALYAAESLADFWPPSSGPERCHELIGDLAGTFSIDLKQPYRLLFEPIEPAAADRAIDERERWRTIKAIRVKGIEDTHG